MKRRRCWILLALGVAAAANWSANLVVLATDETSSNVAVALETTDSENVWVAPPATFYVANDGNDAWSGTLAKPNGAGTDGPFATLEKARDALRASKNNEVFTKNSAFVVEVRGGVYELARPLELTADDCSNRVPTIWRATPGERVQLVGGRYLNGAKKVDDAKVLARLKEDVREKIVALDLKAQGVDEFGTAADGPELFFQGEPTRIARYPNDGFIKITGLSTDGTTPVDIRGTKGVAEGKFQFAEDAPLSWSAESDVWVDGYWFWDWAQQKQRVASIDAATKTMTLEKPHHTYGYRVGQWFYAFNVLAELDAPGEYYLDRDSGVLYFYPPTDSWNDGDFLLSQTSAIATMKNVSLFTWAGFEMLGARGDAVQAENCVDLTIVNCDVLNVGGSGVYVANGKRCVVEGCELWNLGRGGISVSGGDRTTLTPGENRIVENLVHDYARIQRVYATGISTNGVGNYIGHNLVERAPHMGMGFGGNDHLIEFNEIANVCEESNDAGAVYTGRNWTMRGNVLRHNYLHNIRGFENRGCVGIYLDDMFSSAEISGNLFVDVTRAAFIGGGRDSSILDNVFVDCKPALHIDARALGWCADHADGWIAEAQDKGTISGIQYDKPPYSTRYPELASIFAEGKTPKAPEGNVVRGNICVGGTWDVNKEGQWQGGTVEEKARQYLTIEKNYVGESGDNPGFVDAANGDYRLKEDSPLLKDGYKSLPDEEMGLQTPRMKAKAAAARERFLKR